MLPRRAARVEAPDAGIACAVAHRAEWGSVEPVADLVARVSFLSGVPGSGGSSGSAAGLVASPDRFTVLQSASSAPLGLATSEGELCNQRELDSISPTRLAAIFADSIRRPLASPLADHQPALRVSRLVSTPAVEKRRSARIAASRNLRAANPEEQAQNVLMKKLGFVRDDEPRGAEAVAAYCASFRDGVSASKFAAVRELFPGSRWEELVDSTVVEVVA